MYYIETIFDAAYLVLAITLGMIMLRNAKGNVKYSLFGGMAVLLGAGDAFHLVPRIYSMWNPGGFEANVAALGIGKLITSITMTIFYVLLYYVWRSRYGKAEQKGLTFAVLGLAAVRIVLCLFPQNGWTLASSPLSWAIYRNIPFAIVGILMIILFYREAKAINDSAFRHMWLAITLSFAFYLPVVLFADLFPPVGALMLPKTLTYVWMIWMGYHEMRMNRTEAALA